MLLALVATIASPTSLVAGESPEFYRVHKECRERRGAGDLDAAERLGLRLLQIARNDPGSKPDYAALARQQLGFVYEAQGRYREAAEMYQEVFNYWQRAAGEESEIAVQSLNFLVQMLVETGRLKEAEPLALRSARIGDAHPREARRVYDWAVAYNNLGAIYQRVGRNEDAARAFEQGISICQQHGTRATKSLHLQLKANLASVERLRDGSSAANGPPEDPLAAAERVHGAEHPQVATLLIQKGDALLQQGRYRDALQAFERALDIGRKRLSPTHPDLAIALWGTARAHRQLGAFHKSEPLLKEALTIAERTGNPRDLAGILDTLGIVFGQQGRYDEAIALCKRCLAIREEKIPEDASGLAASRHNLATLYAQLNVVPAGADRLVEEAIELRKAELDPGSREMLEYFSTLAIIRQRQGRGDEAERLHRQILAARETSLGADHPDVALSLFNLGRAMYERRRPANALPVLQRAAEVYERARLEVPLGEPILTYAYLARVEFALGQRDECQAHLRKALELSETERTLFSGSDVERAAAAQGGVESLETIIALQAELNDCGMAFSAIEHARARSLIEQMACHGLDVLAGVPVERADSLRRRREEARSRIAQLQRQLKALAATEAGATLSGRSELGRSLAGAREELGAIEAEIANVSPAYRLAIAENRDAASLDALRAWSRRRKTLVMEYFFGQHSGFVLVMPADGPSRLVELVLSHKAAASFSVAAGPLTNALLEKILHRGNGAGVLERLQDGKASEANLRSLHEQLAVLWEVLVPDTERSAIAAGRFERLLISPDGPLAQLPFESLVVEGGTRPKYLLDAAAVVAYAPSATVLLKLVARSRGKSKSVLSVGEPLYPADDSAGPRDGVGRRFALRLTPLPYTGWETAWVAEMFGKHQIATEVLRGKEATERNVAAKATGRAILHFACHGLVETMPGNRFGCLALTPGNDRDLSDDGFLTLAEIYGLKLDGCELAILSACRTNSGPQQRGEGVWSLSRGFLVAGARRVAANNWSVDDEATATMISHFAEALGRQLGAGKTPDYAASLQAARRALRRNPKWQHPYFWAPIVLVGADEP